MKQTHQHRFALPAWLSKSGHKPSRASRVLFVLVAPLFAILLMNSLIAARYEGVIYPGVSVAGIDLSGLSYKEAYSKLHEKPLERKYAVKVGDKVFETTNTELGADYDVDATLRLAYQAGRQEGLPLLGLFAANGQGQIRYSYSLDYARLQKFTTQVVSSIGKAPQNAGVSVKEGKLVVSPDQSGLQVDRQEVTQVLNDSLADAVDATFVLDAKEVKADIRAGQTQAAEDKVADLLRHTFSLSYQGKTFTPTPVNIGYWVKVEPDRAVNASALNVNIDEQQVRGYIQSVANEINRKPVNKKVTVASGKTTVDKEGVVGIAMDQEAAATSLLAAVRAGKDSAIQIVTTEVPFKTETTQTRSLGDGKYIEINLSRQYLWAYENGQVVHSSPITSGATGAGLATATGTFAIYYKATNTYLNGASYGYNYNVFVKYWMPFYLGFGLHDASWRSSFGGSDYYYGGSHGCVNMPDATAAFIYNWSEIGTTVWVH